MDILRQLIERYEAHTQQGIKQNSALCARGIEKLWEQERSLKDAETVHKELLLATVQSCMRDLKHLNGEYKRSVIDALKQGLFKAKGSKRPRSKPFVKKDLVAAKALIDGALTQAETLLLNERFLTKNQQLFFVLMYAALESGLCFEEGLTALYEQLLVSNEKLVKIGDSWVIELHYTRANHETNVRANGQAWTSRLFYPGPMTIFAITGFMKCKSMACIETSAMGVLKGGLAELTGEQSLKSIKNSMLLRACAMIISEQPGTSMGAFLMHYATGDLSSASTSRESLMCMQTQKFQKKTTRINRDNTALAPAKPKIFNKKSIPAHSSDFNQGLRELFKSVHRRDGSKAAYADEVIEALDQFSNNRLSEFSEPEQLLFDWLRHNYQTRNLTKFSSGARYLSSVATVWLDVCERIAVCALEPDEINELYDVLLEKAILTDKQYPELVENLMCFLHKERDIDLPVQLAPENEIKKTHVRSNLPAPAHLNQLLVDIHSVYSDTTFHIRESVLVMLILMMRLGLRPNEVRNLEMKDISLLGAGHIFIRRNSHFKEKSSSSRRQLELNTFLLDQEITLRHSALSSLALASLGSDRSIEKLTPYNIEQAEQIKDFFQPADSFNKLYKLSSVAGHLDSSISLSTYIHNTDLLLYEAVIRKCTLTDLSLIRNLSCV